MKEESVNLSPIQMVQVQTNGGYTERISENITGAMGGEDPLRCKI